MPASPALTRGPAAIGMVVGTAAVLSPQRLLRPFGVTPAEVTGIAALGWRLFGGRTALISGAALVGHQAALDAFIPVQAADQLIFVHAWRSGAVPSRVAGLAMATSAAIVVLDVARRRAG